MKISVVTPVYNSERFIEETMLSILLQEGNFDLQYIIVDGGSTDMTNSVIVKYIHLLETGSVPLRCNSIDIKHISEKDQGMYDAINKGFSHADGEIFCWLNASDTYLPGALKAVALTFSSTQYKWIKGNVCYIDEESGIQKFEKRFIYERAYIANGIQGLFAPFMSQETMFWRRELWLEVGGIDITYKYAGDFYLWKMFSLISPLTSINLYTSCFRRHENQKSFARSNYLAECRRIVRKEMSVAWWIKGYLFKFFLKVGLTREIFKSLIELFPILKRRQYVEISNNSLLVKTSKMMTF